MKSIIPASLLIGLLFVPIGLRAGNDPKKPFEGTWQVQSMTYNGESLPDKELANLKLVIEGKSFKSYKGDKLITQGTFATDAAKKPATVDVLGESEGKKYKMLAIFKLEADTLTICSAEPGSTVRPTAFSSKKGSQQELTVYKKTPQ
jgi:uncharacterized protein (TIGR03067 family)